MCGRLVTTLAPPPAFERYSSQKGHATFKLGVSLAVDARTRLSKRRQIDIRGQPFRALRPGPANFLCRYRESGGQGLLRSRASGPAGLISQPADECPASLA